MAGVGAMQKQYRGFASFDALFSVLPIVLIVVYTLGMHAYLNEKASSTLGRQVLFNKLVSISDYVVNRAAAKSEDGIVYPNWIVREDFGSEESSMAGKMNMKSLSIGFGQGHGRTCIYRLVVFGEQKEIRKLYFCGE
jgi:hypothetical protein